MMIYIKNYFFPILLIFVSPIFFDAQLAGEKRISDSLVNLKSDIPDTSSQYIYDFMKIVIEDQKLNLGYGLISEPEVRCSISQDDKTFLNTLLIDTLKSTTDTIYWKNISSNYCLKCLSKKDIDDMLVQKEKLSNFFWDNSRLGFDLLNDSIRYSFSIPLFSCDRKTVVLMIRKSCPGLCGTGKIVLFKKENSKWTSKIGELWIH